jgi:NADH:ubiquinone oxidoreductase subunit H
MNLIDLIIKPICLIIIAELSWNLFINLKSKEVRAKSTYSKKTSFYRHIQMLSEPSSPSKYIHNYLTLIMPALLFILTVFAILLFPLMPSSFFYHENNTIFFIFSILLSFPAAGIIIALTSQHFSRIQATKELMTKVVQYYFAIILCTIALYIMIYRFQSETESSLAFTFEELIEFQQTKSISIFGIEVPAIFLFLNPIGFIAYMSSVIGLYRETNLDAAPKEMLRTWNVFEEFNGNRKALLGLGQSIQFYLLVGLIVPLFLGIFWGSEDFIVALFKLVISTTIIIQVLALVAEGKPRVLLDRKIKAFVRTPLFLAILSILYSLFFEHIIQIF